MGTLLPIHRATADAPSEAAGPNAREIELVTRARAGDLDAWSRLYHENFDKVFKHAAYLTGDVHVAEDLVQETFAQAFVGLAQFEGRAALIGWLRGIAVNVVRKHWRSRYRGERAMNRLEAMSRDPAAGATTDPEGAHLRQRRAEVLLAVLETLPESMREAFVVCDLQQMPVAEAAATLGVTAGNLRVRATRARTKIRGELVRLGWLADHGASDTKERDDDDR